MDNSKACSMCKSILPLESFYKAKSDLTGRQSRCKECQSMAQKISRQQMTEEQRNKERAKHHANKSTRNAMSRIYYWEHKEELAIKKRIYQLSNPDVQRRLSAKRRAYKMGAKTFDISLADESRLRKNPCIYCGEKSQDLDHIIPLSRGGDHSIGNLAPACRTCNISKKDRFVMEWKMSGATGKLNKKKEEKDNG